jgi:hypothetical protein
MGGGGGGDGSGIGDAASVGLGVAGMTGNVGLGIAAGVVAGLGGLPGGTQSAAEAASEGVIGAQAGPSGGYGSGNGYNTRYNTLVGSKSEGRILGRYGDLSAEDLNRGDDLVFLEPSPYGRGQYNKDAMKEFRGSLFPDEPEEVLSSEPSIQDELDQIDLMNKLAGARNLRFAPARGEEELSRISERDQIVGARGPDLYSRTPRTAIDRYTGSGVAYGSRL